MNLRGRRKGQMEIFSFHEKTVTVLTSSASFKPQTFLPSHALHFTSRRTLVGKKNCVEFSCRLFSRKGKFVGRKTRATHTCRVIYIMEVKSCDNFANSSLSLSSVHTQHSLSHSSSHLLFSFFYFSQSI